MERTYSQTIGSEVLSNTGAILGYVLEVVIDTNTGKIEGFLLAPRGDEVIAARDIIFWNKQLVVADPDDIVSLDDLLKVQKLLQNPISILAKKVFTENGQYLGKVIDFALETKFFMLSKLFVAKTFLGIFSYDDKIIARKNVLEIKEDAIIVKDISGVVTEKSAEEEKNLNMDIAPS